MSRSSRDRQVSISDIRSAYPSLALSGNVISATFNMPHSLRYRKGADWELKARRGQSALFDGLAHLSSDQTAWNHTTVAWTGEIDAPSDFPSPPETPPLTTAHLPGLNKLSAPVPVDKEEPTKPAPPTRDGLWIPKEDMQRLEQQLGHDKKIKTVPVWLADDADGQEDGILLKDQARWRRYADHDLYTLFHYKTPVPSDGRKERTQWADYYRMNQKFANKILELYKPGDIVVVHDYYLMLVPSMLRQRVPHMYISFFLHCPFPSSEFLRCLPRRKEVLEGVLGSNLIGFQSYSYSRHFSSCCTRICSYPSDAGGVETFGARVEVGVFPIGIDAKKVESMAFCPAVDEKVKALRKLYAGKKLIVGRDRLDSVRGVAQKLMAFDRFLELYPGWRERVVLIQVTSPTASAGDEEKDDPENKIASRVNEWIGRIHGTYGHLGYDPVQHFPQYLSQDEYFALLRAADIGLITSVRDGMNTTSLEYIVCQRDNNGPLILSEFSGTAGSLRDAIHINPWDLSGVADEINNALVMEDEARLAMQKSLHDHVTSKNVQHWIDSLLNRLVHVLGSSKNVVSTPLLDRAIMLQTYLNAKKRLFMFDYDGTLTPIVKEPSAAIPSQRLINTLTTLASDHRNAVWIISGRDQAFLTQHLGGIKELGFSAEHGSFMKHPGSDEWENLAETFDMGWQPEVMDVFQSYTDKCPGSFIERKRCALTWHYRLADPEQGPHMAEECQKELEATVVPNWDVDVMAGKANVEVRTTFVNKGEIAKRLVNSYNSDMSNLPGSACEPSAADADKNGKLGFVLCLGDDTTDEDMFRALNGVSATPDQGEEAKVQPEHVFTVTVGASTKVTLARWHLLEPNDVVDSVALLADVGANGTGTAGGTALHIGEVNLAALSAVEGHVPTE
ncbi:family 20 glycosyltransferase [Cryphonectria parasitica EP155]|uniref:Family 20 glycosyltransferase n=1 Tax=Cryphonectria parasitica (strain ATCC 38755 / EP155) TaxID=660469 RepID=A0A9P4XZ05_CRYP1|nr:family 20 glycosyltransferase [Cryphonectria parasitica EP155]KAF3763929.1 family 20 glycosyltransferase [Cryphonectria parasitica EP155]